LFESSSVPDEFDALFAVFLALFGIVNIGILSLLETVHFVAGQTNPFCQKKTWEHGIDSDLWSLRGGQTFHQVETCCLGDGVAHAATALRYTLSRIR
jgi:hypothetical protein